MFFEIGGMMKNGKFENNLEKMFFISDIILMLWILAGDVCYIVLDGLVLKSLTSALFVVLGLVNLSYVVLRQNKSLKFPIIMVVGLVFAMCGDIVLEVEFVVGAVLFAVGHVFYFVAYCFLQKFKWIDLVYGAVIFVPSVLFITLAPIFDFGGILMEIVCVVYAVIISCMVGKSISNLVSKRNLQNLIIMIGSILFFFSDLMLLLNVFASLPRVVGVLCLATYYPAEWLLGFSIFLHSSAKEEK